MADVVEVLHEERKALQKRLAAVETALAAFGSKGGQRRGGYKRSAAVRKKLSEAAKLRWAKTKKTTKSKGEKAETAA